MPDERKRDGSICEKCSSPAVQISHMYEDMCPKPETRRFTKDEVLAVAGDWMLLAGPGDGEHQFATKVAGLDPADCPAALLLARSTGDGISQMARDLLGELADAGNHVIALCVIEDYFAKLRSP